MVVDTPEQIPLLTTLLILPLIGILVMLFIRSDDEERIASNCRAVALWTSLVTFLLSLRLWIGFDPTIYDFQFVEDHTWIDAIGARYHLGIDGISLPFILLTTFLVPVCIFASWESIKERVREYMIAFLLLETMIIGVFASLDTVLFYIFFEGVLIPMFLIIGIWGGPRRIYATFKFFLYTLLGSLLMLIALIAIYLEVGSTSMPLLMDMVNLPVSLQVWIWWAFFASFAVKVPMWPFHTWLPDAHVEAPTAGSVILAGVLLKLGGYGFLRFSLPMAPIASEMFAPFIMTISVIAIIYTSLIALVQTDMKKMIAYSSVAHMGFVTLGIFSLTRQGIDGAMIQMISHGIISAALFLCVGVIYDRLHTREIDRYGGLSQNMPNYAVIFMIFMLGSVGLPGTSGFVGEFLALLGTYQASKFFALFGAIGMVLGAAYMLRLYREVLFGEQKNKDAAEISDINHREKLIFIPLVALVFVIGIYPTPLLRTLDSAVETLMEQTVTVETSPDIVEEGYLEDE